MICGLTGSENEQVRNVAEGIPSLHSYQNASMHLANSTSRAFQQIIRIDALHTAWQRVKSNGGGPGGDHVTADHFGRNLKSHLAKLADDLASGRYRPGPLAHYRIPKGSGGWRELAVPSIGDRVAQTAVLFAISQQLDIRMADESFAYRPGRSVEQALDRAHKLADTGLVWIVDADIERFFDSVCHRTLLQELAIWIDDARLLALVGLWLSAWGRSRRGLPQGAPLSPLLANLYLHPFDRLLAAAGISAVRYADDFILLCRSRASAEHACRLARTALRSRGLLLNKDKTRIAHVDEGIKFLGQVLVHTAEKVPRSTSSAPPWEPRPQTPSAAVGGNGFMRRTLRCLLGASSARRNVAKADSSSPSC